LYRIILDNHSYVHDLKDFSFTFTELPNFNKGPGDVSENMSECCCYFFKHAPQIHESHLKRTVARHAILQKVYEPPDQLCCSEPEHLAYEHQLQRIGDEKAIVRKN
jgi:hypothetical protein